LIHALGLSDSPSGFQVQLKQGVPNAKRWHEFLPFKTAKNPHLGRPESVASFEIIEEI